MKKMDGKKSRLLAAIHHPSVYCLLGVYIATISLSGVLEIASNIHNDLYQYDFETKSWFEEAQSPNSRLLMAFGHILFSVLH